MRSVLDEVRHLSVVAVGIHDDASAPFVLWENHDGIVLFEVFERVSQFLRDVKLW